MDQRTDAIRQDIDATRDSMTGKIEQIESRVKGTVDDIKGSVENTVETVKQTFDVRQQVSDRPWTMFGASVLAGYVLGSLGGSEQSSAFDTYKYREPSYRSYSESSAPSSVSGSSSDYKSSDYRGSDDRSYSYNRTTSTSGRSGGSSSGFISSITDQFGDELETLKSAAMVTVGNMLRDMMRKNLPQFAEEFERARSERDSSLRGGASSQSGTQSYDPLERSVGEGTDASYQVHAASPGPTVMGTGATTPSSTIRTPDPVSQADRNTTY